MVKKISSFTHSLKWGIIIGIVLIIYSLFLYFFNIYENRILGLLSFFLLFLGSIVGINDYKNNKNGGFINFTTAFGIGLIIFLSGGIILIIYSFFQLKFIDPEMIERSINLAEDKLNEKGFDYETIKNQMIELRKLMSPIKLSFISLIFNLIFGTISSFILAAILKKEHEINDPI